MADDSGPEPSTDSPPHGAGASAVPPTAGRTGAERGEDRAQERFGPLAIERHRKDDGRALLLYRHADERSA